MKFQKPSIHGFGRTDNPKPICPVNFLKVGGIIVLKLEQYCFLNYRVMGPHT